MLYVAGTVLEVDRRWAGKVGEEFEQITVKVLSGKADVERVRLGRDFAAPSPAGNVPEGKFPIPEEQSEVVLGVVASAYTSRNGAGLQLTALRDETERLAPMLLDAS